jgi:hypothetical protein
VPVILLFAQTVVVAMFGSSALAKARDLDAFHSTLLAFRVAADRPARLLAPVVLGAEVLAIVLAVLVPYAGLGLAAGLLVAYTVLLASARARGTMAGCHCFGRRPLPLSWWDVGRNVVLLAAVLAGFAGSGFPDDPGPAVGAGVALVLVAVHLRAVATALAAPLPVEETS